MVADRRNEESVENSLKHRITIIFKCQDYNKRRDFYLDKHLTCNQTVDMLRINSWVNN